MNLLTGDDSTTTQKQHERISEPSKNTTHNTINNTNNIIPTHHHKTPHGKVTVPPNSQVLATDQFPSYRPPQHHYMALSTPRPQPNNNLAKIMRVV